MKRMIAGLLFVVFSTGCYSASAREGDRVAPAQVAVEIRNDSFQDVTVYEVSDGQRIKVSKVTAMATETKKLRIGPDGQVQFLLSIGVVSNILPTSEQWQTQPEPVRVGNLVMLRIRNHLPNSYVFISN